MIFGVGFAIGLAIGGSVVGVLLNLEIGQLYNEIDRLQKEKYFR